MQWLVVQDSEQGKQADVEAVALLKGVSLNLGGGRTEQGGNSGELQTSQTSTHLLGMEPLSIGGDNQTYMWQKSLGKEVEQICMFDAWRV